MMDRGTGELNVPEAPAPWVRPRNCKKHARTLSTSASDLMSDEDVVAPQPSAPFHQAALRRPHSGLCGEILKTRMILPDPASTARARESRTLADLDRAHVPSLRHRDMRRRPIWTRLCTPATASRRSSIRRSASAVHRDREYLARAQHALTSMPQTARCVFPATPTSFAFLGCACGCRMLSPGVMTVSHAENRQPAFCFR